MRYLVLSDIHANLEALEAVLASASGFDRTLVLGDVIGYGADPNAVVDRLRGISNVTFIRGNHDKVGTGLEGVAGFNHLARQAIQWTASALTPDNHAWVAALDRGPVDIDDLVEISHGSPFDEDAYIFDELDVRQAFRVARRPLSLFGHTHVPAAFCMTGPRLLPLEPPRGSRYDLSLEPDSRYLLNCGAVGQPRDGDPRAAYGVVDTQARTVTVMRVEYDVAVTQAKILTAGLPEVLAHRLAIGR
jgi:diadenosine tetraphosphatase ApaH/serine/threonine PP2A family protein phosphatase